MNSEKQNFILPETENSLNKIIFGIQNFFSIYSLFFNSAYFLYAATRIFLMKNFLILNILLAIISSFITAFMFLDYFSKIKPNKMIKSCYIYIRRILCLSLTSSLFINIFTCNDHLLPYRIIFAFFCIAGIFISICGWIFSFTVPLWVQEILSSFKRDIEISGLFNRSINHVKDAFQKDENLKEKVIDGSVIAGGSFLLHSLRNLIHDKNKK